MLTHWTFLCMSLGMHWIAISQTDSTRVDSVAPIAALRVRSFAEVNLIDSIWSDSLWTWTGPCDGPIRSFRFEFPDSTFCSIEFSCSPNEPELSDLSTSLTSSAGAPHAQIWEAVAMVSVRDLEAMPRMPLATSCFPPASEAIFQQLITAMERAFFEIDKCAVLTQASTTTCLTRQQMSQALQRIPSEDRKLETMERITRSENEWTETELREMFQLNFILERALKRFEKR